MVFVFFFFSVNSNPLFISVTEYLLWFRVVFSSCSSLRRVFLRFLFVIILCILRARV